jgi:hypothetical protein
MVRPWGDCWNGAFCNARLEKSDQRFSSLRVATILVGLAFLSVASGVAPVIEPAILISPDNYDRVVRGADPCLGCPLRASMRPLLSLASGGLANPYLTGLHHPAPRPHLLSLRVALLFRYFPLWTGELGK